LYVDYLAHLDCPGHRDQREGIRDVYRMAQALSQNYERGRGLVVVTPVQANKAAEKTAAEPEAPLEKGIYREGDIGAIEYHTDAGRGMDALIGVWSGPGFREHGLVRISCIKSRQMFFAPFFMKVDEASQMMDYMSDHRAADAFSGRSSTEHASDDMPAMLSADIDELARDIAAGVEEYI
jgi:hypothetical protein